MTVGAVVALSVGAGRGSSPQPRTPLPLAPAASAGPLHPAPAPGGLGAEQVPVPVGAPLGPAGGPSAGTSIDGIGCQAQEQVRLHVHAHLTLFVRGEPVQVPAGIGIAPPIYVKPTTQGPFVSGGTCFSWLHTHAPDGIVHVEAPVVRVFTLGEFFDVWGQRLDGAHLGPDTGRVVAFYDGRRYVGSPRQIPLVAHAQIQLEVGRPVVAPETIGFPAGL